MKKIFLSILIAFLAFTSVGVGAVLLTGCNYSEGQPDSSQNDGLDETPENDDGSQDGKNPDESIEAEGIKAKITLNKYVMNTSGTYNTTTSTGGGSVFFKLDFGYNGHTIDYCRGSATLGVNDSSKVLTASQAENTSQWWIYAEATASTGFSFDYYYRYPGTNTNDSLYNKSKKYTNAKETMINAYMNENWSIFGETIGNFTFDVNFKRNQYTLTFDPNGGDVVTNPKDLYYEQTYGTLPEATRTGYVFKGWYTAKSGGTKVSDATAMGTSNTVVYAQWQLATYTVTYNANGGSLPSGSATSKTVTYSSTYGTLPTPTRSGCTFAGWYTSKTYASQVTSSTKVTTTKDHSIYAKWTCTVSYNANGGSGTVPTTQTVTVGNSATVATNKLTRTGYTSNGWNTLAVIQATPNYANGASISPTANTTLYANWTANTYTLTYNANGGSLPSGTSSTKTVTYDHIYGELPTPTRTGYTFGGWYTSTSYTTRINVSTTVSTASNHTIYAKWTANTYTLTYDANGGSLPSGTSSTKTVTYDSTYGTLATPSRSGCTFAGWYTTKTFGTQITSSTKVSMTTNHTVYAKWTCTVTYNSNGGSGTVPSTQTVTVGNSVTIATNNLTRTGYTANNWNSSSTLSSTAGYSNGASISPTSSITLYANWIPQTVYVRIRFLVCDDLSSNLYKYSEILGGAAGEPYVDLTYDISYKTTTISGNATTTGTVTDRNRWANVDNALASNELTISGISIPKNWTCNKIFMESYNASNYNSNRTILPSNLDIQSGSLTTKKFNVGTGTKFIYICLKKIGNPLKYDSVEQYFYFEDGEFPQMAVVTYNDGFNTVLGNGLTTNANAISNLETFVSNGITFYTFTYKEDAADGDYYAYNGQRFLGFASQHAKSLKLRNSSGTLTNYTFTVGKLYFFRYDPIRWRVSDYGVSEDNPPADWDAFSEGQANKNVVSDVLWIDALNTNELGVGDDNTQTSLMQKLMTRTLLGQSKFNFEYSNQTDQIPAEEYASASSGNAKVTPSNSVTMRYVRIKSNGYTNNIHNHLVFLKAYDVSGNEIVVADASTNSNNYYIGAGQMRDEGGYFDMYTNGVLTFDLKEKKNIVKFSWYSFSGRKYYGKKIEYSNDNINWYTFWDSGNKGHWIDTDGNGVADTVVHDDTGLYTENSAGTVHYAYTNMDMRVASIGEIDGYLTDRRSRASHLVCVLTGQNQTRYAEYWTRDFGQQMGMGTYVSSTGTTVTNSAYDQSPNMRYLRIYADGSVSGGYYNHIGDVKVTTSSGNEIVLLDATNDINLATYGIISKASVNGQNYYHCYNRVVHGEGNNYVQFDLGSTISVSAVWWQRYYVGAAKYYGQKVLYSEDGNTWYTYWDSGNKGYWSDASTKVHDDTGLYSESSAGKLVNKCVLKGVRFAITMTESSNVGV